MHVTGLITEYNPFHNGHLFHLKKARETAGADYTAVVMSGSFVQRGAPAVFDKYSRTRAALLSGADLVFEMPAPFSTASAREFASYAVALFTALGAVDSICFGSECGEIEPILRAARLLNEESEPFKKRLQDFLKEGKTFPEARSAALAEEGAEEAKLLSSPNNILGVEYCQAVLRQRSPLSCFTIKREGNGYHDPSLNGALGSALAVRQALQSGTDVQALRFLLPDPSFDSVCRSIPVFLDDFSGLLNYRLLTEQEPERYAEIRPELAARIKKLAPGFASFDQRIKELKSRQLTYTGVSRGLIHLILGIEQRQMDLFKEAGFAPYARILGFRKSAAPLLRRIKENSSIPVISKLAGAEKRLDPAGAAMLACEIQSSHLYQNVRCEKAASGAFPGRTAVFQNEYTQPVLILDQETSLLL
ncbi:MAG: nucleotidyltransferase family protein [Clostridium sp.]|nr:nucleotidyltransferase family protein [Clostridium sp.]MBS6913518.1 nucleotidyltransferase family protein [Clostridium sp.]